MQPNLVVVRPFGLHAIGDVIVAPDVIAQVLASDHANHVVQVAPRQTEA